MMRLTFVLPKPTQKTDRGVYDLPQISELHKEKYPKSQFERKKYNNFKYLCYLTSFPKFIPNVYVVRLRRWLRYRFWDTIHQLFRNMLFIMSNKRSQCSLVGSLCALDCPKTAHDYPRLHLRELNNPGLARTSPDWSKLLWTVRDCLGLPQTNTDQLQTALNCLKLH